MKHPTTIVENAATSPDTIFVLTGPPAAGKSTIQNLLEDFGVPVIDTSDLVRDEVLKADDLDDGTPDDHWTAATRLRDKHGDSAPTSLAKDRITIAARANGQIVCVGGVREQAEVNWLDDTFKSRVLVAKIDAPGNERTNRYIERHINGAQESVDGNKTIGLADELYDRELREQPYPSHHVTIENHDGTTMSELTARLSGLITAFAGSNATTTPGETV